MKLELLYENTWKIEDEGVRFFYLKGRNKAMVIDTGRSGLNIQSEIGNDMPCELLNTHADPDHTAGNHFFPVFYMHPSEAPVYYNLHNGIGSFLPIYDGDVLDLGGRELEIVHIPGHTPGSISVLDRRSRILIGGDPVQCNGQIYMFGIHRELHSYVYGLKKLMARTDFDYIYPSHADTVTEKSIIPELISGAESIINGSAKGIPLIVHGKEVLAYNTGRNVLLCNQK